MKYEEIERLVRLVAETQVDEVEVKQGGVRVRVRRRFPAGEAAAGAAATLVPAPAGWAAPAPQAQALPVDVAARPAEAPTEEEEEAGLHVVTASMVGTFYRRANPEAEPFVKEGDVVKKGQVICILEAMKIFNEIESDASGTVVKVFVEEGQPVEFGEKLLALRPL